LAGLNKPAVLEGGAGNDALAGGAGDQYRFTGVRGKDKVTDWTGADRLDVSSVTAGMAFTRAASLTAATGVIASTAAGVESVGGGAGPDRLTAATGANVFTLEAPNTGLVGTVDADDGGLVLRRARRQLDRRSRISERGRIGHHDRVQRRLERLADRRGRGRLVPHQRQGRGE